MAARHAAIRRPRRRQENRSGRATAATAKARLLGRNSRLMAAHPSCRPEHPTDVERRRRRRAPAAAAGAVAFSGCEQRVRRGSGGQRFAQPARRKDAIGQVFLRDQQKIDISSQREVLKSVVQQVHCGAQLALGQPACEYRSAATSTATPGSARASISGSSPAVIEPGEDRRAVGDHRHSVERQPPRIPAGQDRRRSPRAASRRAICPPPASCRCRPRTDCRH